TRWPRDWSSDVCSSDLGAAITPPLVVLIMTTLGWRWVFYICAAVGIVWSALWYLAYRNLPEEHGLVNKTELEHIRGIDAAGNVRSEERRVGKGEKRALW